MLRRTVASADTLIVMTQTWTAPTAAPRPPRRRWPVWAKVLLTFALVVVTGLALFVGAIVVSFSGGLDDVLDVRKPSQDSRSVGKARSQATARVEPLHAVVTAGFGATDTGVRVSKDDCQTGQHNWKIDDPYDLDCVLSRGSVYVLPYETGATDDAALAAALDESLQGWTPQDAYVDQDHRRWTRGGPADGAAGVQEVTITVEDGLVVGGLRPYEVGGGYTEPGEPTGITRDGRPYNVQDLRNDYPGRLVVVTTSERYFYE